MLANAQKDLRLCTIAADQIALALACVLALGLRLFLPIFPHTAAPSLEHFGFVARYLALMVLWYACMSGTGNYDVNFPEPRRIWNAVKGTLLFTLLVLAIAFFRWTLFSRAAVILFVLLASALTVVGRDLTPRLLKFIGRHREFRILLLGEGEWADHLARLLQRRFGYKVFRRSAASANPANDLVELESWLQEIQPSEVIVASQGRTLDDITALLNQCNHNKVPWHFVPTLDQLVLTNVRTQLVGGLPLIGVKSCELSGTNLLLKRAFDLTIASAILVAAAPLMGLIWMMVKLTSPGPAIFVQKRIGRRGRSFDFYKFRTMYVHGDDSAHREYARHWISNRPYQESGDKNKKMFKIVGDKRITSVGRLLRRYSLDELPQIFNVLKGDMSLVGPRPALSYELEMYQEWHKERLEGMPGVTGLWQVAGRNQLSFDEMVKLDLEYLRNWTPTQDLKVLIRTVPAIIMGSGD